MASAGSQAGASAIERVLKGGLRLRLSRRASGLLGGLALILGVALVADAIATVVWQDPITAVFTQADQKALTKKLARLERAPLPPSTLALVKNAGSAEARMAVLAKDLERRSGAGDPLGRIAVPRAGVNFVFVVGTGESSLRKGPGHYAGTALPGQHGTVAIAGHRTTYSAPFRRLDRLRRGDSITLTMPYGRFAYDVEGERVVAPSNVSVLRHARHDRLVLTTCTPPFSAAKRLILTARASHATPRGKALDMTPLPPVAPSWTQGRSPGAEVPRATRAAAGGGRRTGSP
jgi:sortase A